MKDDLVQAIASPAEGQCDQLHAVPTYPSIRPLSAHWPRKEPPAAPDCKCCRGTGIRDVWVVDGWSFTDCLCKYGWTVDDNDQWKDTCGRNVL